MKLPLLRIVQKVLSSMDGDEINSISDSIESMQVAEIVEDVFYLMVANRVIPEHKQLLKVEALADIDKPIYLKLPTSVERLELFRYNVSTDEDDPNYTTVDYLDPQEFIRITEGRRLTEPGIIEVVDFSGVKLKIDTDKRPDFWTSFDDEHMVFDSFNINIESTLQSSKTMCFGMVSPSFTKEDSFIPDIDDNFFPMLIAEAKVWAHSELKQTAHTKAEQQSKRQRNKIQNDLHRFKLKVLDQTTDVGARPDASESLRIGDKVLGIRSLKGRNGVEFYLVGGGNLPKDLTGLFLSSQDAIKHLKYYLGKKRDEEG